MRSSLFLVVLLVVLGSCSSRLPSATTLETSEGGTPDAGDLDTGEPGVTDGTFNPGSGDASQGDSTPGPCNNPPNVDGDHDGFTGAQGDCNDCDPNVNPGAYDVPGNGVDEDCDGVADDEPTGCDHGLAIDATDATLAAKAIGICRKQSGESWGLVSAAWVFPDGTATASKTLPGCPAMSPPNPLSHGLLTSFGTNGKPRDGSTMLAISNGAARAGTTNIPSPGQGTSPQSGIMCTASAFPAGFPKHSPSCPAVVSMQSHDTAYDGMALELHLKVPTNASGLSFDFNFFSTEFPQEICSMYGYNDQFVALLWSKAASTPADHDMSFDSMGDPVDVDSAFIQVCTPTTYNGTAYACPLGSSLLDGTAVQQAMGDGNGGTFESGGATGWLTTTASVVPGETIVLRFAIWDAGDNILDSTTLLDRLTWSLASGNALPPPSAPPATVRPPR